jgi:choline dehydrogenase-like flavoprotein
MIVQGHEIKEKRSLEAHTVVVGTGAGGGVAAFHLAEAGVDTLILEEGGYHVASEFNQREEDMFPMLYRSGGAQTTSDGMINVLQGSCFGGGTNINTSDCEPIPTEVLEHWQKLTGTSEWTAKSLEESTARVNENLNARRVNKSLINRNNGMLMEGAKKLGWKSYVMESNRKGCVGSGYCVVGCSYKARLGTNITYIPWAIEKGARLYTDVRCDRIEKLSGGRYRLHCTVVERGVRAARLPLTVDCQRVVLAASSIHTPAILMRSGLHKELPQIGKNLTLQPQLGIISFFKDDVIHWRGAPQSVAVSEFDTTSAEHGLSGFVIEGWGGVVGMPSALIPGFGVDHKRLTARMRQTAIHALLLPDKPSGSIRYKWDEEGRVHPIIDYTMRPEWKQTLVEGMKRAGELLFSLGATEVCFTNQGFPVLKSADELNKVEQFPIEPGLASFVSAHNQSTCRMGSSRENSVVDQNLRLHTGDNIYVMDSSVMPSSASTHVMQPIMVVADRGIHRMLED